MNVSLKLTVVIFLAFVLAGCQHTKDPIPNCSDNETLDLVRQIIGKMAMDSTNAPSEETLRKRLTFQYPRATKLVENIKKYSCEAELIVISDSQQNTIQISYESQLDDKNQHLVNVSNLNIIDAATIQTVLSIPSPEVTSASKPLAEETIQPKAETSLSEKTEEDSVPTPEQIKQNQSIRQAILDGNQPSGEYPRFRDYAVPETYSGPSAKLDMSSDEAKNFKTRLNQALQGGEISAAGEYILAGWGCGSGGCVYDTFINKRTGQVIENGIGGDGNEQLVGYDAKSRLVISEGAEMDNDSNELGYFAFFYELTDNKLNLIKKVSIPRSLEE